MKTLKTQLLHGGIESQDDEEGNYYVVDPTQNDQFLVHVHSDMDGNLMAHSCKHRQSVPLEEFNKPQYRWFKIEPLDVKAIESLLMPV